MTTRISFLAIFMLVMMVSGIINGQERKRARDLGVHIGVLKPGKWNAITDVAGVKVGHTTLIVGDNIRTGVTAIIPHGGNMFRDKVSAAVFVGNAFGKAVGFTQVEELGTIETPITLTNTLNTFLVADAVIEYMLSLPENSNVGSINPVVGETNDGGLNDIRGRHVKAEHVRAAIENAQSGEVEEGSVGAGTGTRALGFKGGIGTSSRVLPEEAGGYTVGVLVQTNFGGILSINGAPIAREMGRSTMSRFIPYDDEDEGSCMIVIATDAPLSPRNLKRLAKRSYLAFGKVGSYSSNGSGDYSIAFSTHPDVRDNGEPQGIERITRDVKNSNMSNLFLAVVEATEEAIINSLFMATDITGKGRTSRAIPLDETIEIMKKYNSLNWNDKLFPWKK
ncbi:P1 family peptidase [candidate division KSB1 bacterium]|nr:P1 family peptidase [candidate division KSB1 bacterium]